MTLPIKHPCIMCDGTGRDEFSGNVRSTPCQSCDGRGWKYASRDVAFDRRKEYVGEGHPLAAKGNGYEKWVRYCCEVPPEIAELIDAACKRAFGSASTHAGIARYGLRLVLDKLDPEEELLPVDSDAVPEVEVIPIMTEAP